jgi:hypothetical protein
MSLDLEVVWNVPYQILYNEISYLDQDTEKMPGDITYSYRINLNRYILHFNHVVIGG